MRRALVRALRARGVDVLTAWDAGRIERSDQEHLEYAAAQGRVLYSFNVGDFYRGCTPLLWHREKHTLGSSSPASNGTLRVSRHAAS